MVQLDNVEISLRVIVGCIMPLSNLLQRELTCRCGTRRFRPDSKYCDNCGESLVGQDKFITQYDRANRRFLVAGHEHKGMGLTVRELCDGNEVYEGHVLIGDEVNGSTTFGPFNAVTLACPHREADNVEATFEKHLSLVKDRLRHVKGLSTKDAKWGVFAWVSK
jgi:hypothetical protein